jgi:hypothetical protein
MKNVTGVTGMMTRTVTMESQGDVDNKGGMRRTKRFGKERNEMKRMSKTRMRLRSNLLLHLSVCPVETPCPGKRRWLDLMADNLKFWISDRSLTT